MLRRDPELTGHLGIVAGATYLLPLSYAVLIAAGDLTFITADNFLGWTKAPAWMDTGNGTYQFPPWYLREWCWSESDYGYKSTGILFAVTPDFRTTSLSGICVLEMIRKDA